MCRSALEANDEAAAHAKASAETFVVGPADAPGNDLGGLVSQVQYDKIQDLIESGISEGEYAEYGLEDFLEIKGILGCEPA